MKKRTIKSSLYKAITFIIICLVITLLTSLAFANPTSSKTECNSQTPTIEKQQNTESNKPTINPINNAEIKAILNQTETKATLMASDSIIQGGQVMFAVWNIAKGQNPIKWYYTNNAYTVAKNECNIIDFKASGKYAVHVYYKNPQGQETFLGASEFSVSPLTAGQISITDKDKSNLSFKINETSVKSISGVSKFMFAVWTEKGGQDDIKWTNAKATLNSDNTYSSQITEYLSNHKYENGNYVIHVYAVGNNGVETRISAIAEPINLVDSNISSTLNDSETKASLVASNPIIQGGQVMFAVWNIAKGQNPIKWYYTNNAYTVAKNECNIIDFKASGKYAVHVYYKNPQGQETFLGSSEFNVSSLSTGNVFATDKDTINLTFNIYETGIKSPSGVSKFMFAVWTERGGQDDLKWTDGKVTHNQDNTYSSQITEYLSNHKYENGNYIIHVYAVGKNGVETRVSAITEPINLVHEGFYNSVNDDETITSLRIVNSKINSASKIQFAVWSAVKQQKDIMWYNATKDHITGNYNVKISDFKQLGRYYVHAYITTSSGTLEFIDSTSFTINPPYFQTLIENVDGHYGTFNININDVHLPLTIQNIKVATWTPRETGAHATWYTATKLDPLNYKAISDVKDHDFEFGSYNIHVYAFMKNGCEYNASQHSTNIQPNDYLGVKRMGNTMYRACAKGLHASASRVQFPTWSETQGQDDLIWYEGTQHSDNTWTADFSARCHFHEGKFATHCYMFNKTTGLQEFINGVSYQVPKEDIRKQFNLYHGITQGIDVSEHQANINWDAVANSNQVGYAMIRIGFGTQRSDYQFSNNYLKAVSKGIPVGGYWYSYATSVQGAEQEARKCLEILNGRYFDLPIAFDLEQHPELDANTNTAMINAFCSILQNAGYQPMVYASESWYNGKFYPNNLNAYISFWVAKWSSKQPDVPHSERMRVWQFTSNGGISGIDGRVDMDHIYY